MKIIAIHVTLTKDSDIGYLNTQGFIYDGLGPAAYFWIDSRATPSASGKRLLDATPSNECGMKKLPRGQGETYNVEFPAGMTIRDFLGGCKLFLFSAFDTRCVIIIKND